MNSLLNDVNISPEKRAKFAEWIRKWRKDTIYTGFRKRLHEAVEKSTKSGISDKDILIETDKAIRRAKRKL